MKAAVSAVWRRHRAYVEFSDAMQTAYAWFYGPEGQAFVAHHADDGKAIARRASYAARRYCAREKVSCGMADPDDVFLYGTGVLRRLLPLAVHGLEPQHGTGLSDEPKARKDPAIGGDVLVMVCDVQLALAALPVNDRDFLELCVDYDNDWAAVAELLGSDRQAVKGRFERLMFELRDELRGQREEREYVGSRKVLSNAAAQAATDL